MSDTSNYTSLYTNPSHVPRLSERQLAKMLPSRPLERPIRGLVRRANPTLDATPGPPAPLRMGLPPVGVRVPPYECINHYTSRWKGGQPAFLELE